MVNPLLGFKDWFHLWILLIYLEENHIIQHPHTLYKLRDLCMVLHISFLSNLINTFSKFSENTESPFTTWKIFIFGNKRFLARSLFIFYLFSGKVARELYITDLRRILYGKPRFTRLGLWRHKKVVCLLNIERHFKGKTDGCNKICTTFILLPDLVYKQRR